MVGLVIETITNADDLLTQPRIPSVSQSFTNFVLILFEDIPLLVLNLIVTACRDGEPTLVSVVKASVCIGAVCIRLVFMILFYWVVDGKKNRWHFLFDLLATVGLVVMAIMSITIQVRLDFDFEICLSCFS